LIRAGSGVCYPEQVAASFTLRERSLPLLDHFHPPLFPQRAWESFHSRWANSIADALHRVLPRRYYAEVQIHLGSQVEADNGEEGYEVQMFNGCEGPHLVAVVELVSPRNKDRAESRRAFGAKCAAYLQRGVGLIVLDIVTSRGGNLHNELVQVLNLGEPFRMPPETSLYAVAYRPARREENQIDVWPHALAIGGALPLLPVALRGASAVPLDLEAAYTEARERSRL
jgi:hypothetical protein